MRNVIDYLNPITRLGKKSYSIFFPLLLTLAITGVIEFIFYTIVGDPNAVGLIAIFVYIALIIYFSFRDGIRGGLITAGLTIGYYFYIIYTRGYKGEQLTTGVETTIILGVLYFMLAAIIGWLKQTIDTLIDREATEKRRMQAILQQLPVGVIIVDSNGKIVQSNRRVEDLLGIKIPLGFAVGKDKSILRAKYKNKEYIASPSQSPLYQTLITGKSLLYKEYEIERTDGKKVFLQVSTAPIHNRYGKVVAAAQIMNDVTQQKEMEKRKDDFVNMASHELKTPITSMKLYLDFLGKHITHYKDERADKTIKNIRLQTEKLQELVSDLLDVSRIQTGKLTFRKERFNITELVKETVDSLQGTVKQEITFSQYTPLYVYADRFRVYQVITNLITNAAKYSKADETINLRVKRSNGKAFVSVQDFGIGIAKDQQRKIFDRLYQVTDEKEKTFPGLGMGLYISREIIVRHKGSIWVESEKGKGSTFYFSLPLQKK